VIKTAAVMIARLALTLVFIEGALQVATFVSAPARFVIFPDRMPPIDVPDDVLVVRPNPAFPEHDRNGFRNRDVPQQADIVALGDSQTYGITAARDDAWPQQLERMSGRRTYNMGFGGYGPGQYLLLLDEALRLKPKLVIVALYSGNDLYDAFRIAYVTKKLPEFITADPDVRAAIAAADATETIDHRSYRTAGRPQPNDAVGSVVLDSSPAPSEIVVSPRVFLAENSALWGLLRAAKREIDGRLPGADRRYSLSWDAVRDEALAQPDVYLPVDGASARTVLMPAYRLGALDQTDPRIREGLRISLEAMGRIGDRLRSEGIGFAVLMIPTTEFVFEETAASQTPLSPTYLNLLAHENAFWELMKRYLDDREIPWVDAAGPLRDATRRGEQVYPIDANGHPNARGYRIIAETLLSQGARLGITSAR
jgi:lysophospholipase L1-like esterase